MIYYQITCTDPSTRLFQIELIISDLTTELINIQLPAWRPGRYELQHFAKNIQRFEVFGLDNQGIQYQKITKDRWQINANYQKEIKICYTYYANKQDAGNSYVDDAMWYLNFVNCLPYVEGRMLELHQVKLQLPDNYQLACGLPEVEKHTLLATDYYELVDCPLLASAHLQHDSYQVGETTFHLWFLGNYEPNFLHIKRDFKRFTIAQIQQFGDFPTTDNSTMIVLGPDAEGDGLYPDLLGVSSHELYHTWNICRIRPAELLPYNFTQENYFPTGFVAEGVTTYMGDLFLKQSGVFSMDDYLKELGTTLKRHFEKDGRAWQSLVESSFDLWLDGYAQPIPNRRVSIYNKGAVIALILDLHIRQQTDHQKSLHDVMRLMWERFGKPFEGYSMADYQHIAEEICGESLDWYKQKCIEGNEPLETLLNKYLQWVGLRLNCDEANICSLIADNEKNEDLAKWLR